MFHAGTRAAAGRASLPLRMTREEIAALKVAFSESVEPITTELKAIHGALHEQSQLLRSIDKRLTNVEGILDGVEILVRRKAG